MAVFIYFVTDRIFVPCHAKITTTAKVIFWPLLYYSSVLCLCDTITSLSAEKGHNCGSAMVELNADRSPPFYPYLELDKFHLNKNIILTNY